MDVFPRGDADIRQGSDGRRSLHGAGYQTKNKKLERINMLVPKTHPLLISAIEEGTTYGYRRAHKHTETPSEFEICSAITDAIMYQIAEVFEFVDPKSTKL